MSIKTGLEYVGYIDTWTGEERLTDEEVMRCRDCAKTASNHGEDFDENPYMCLEFFGSVPPDGFCAWGVRREDA